MPVDNKKQSHKMSRCLLWRMQYLTLRHSAQLAKNRHTNCNFNKYTWIGSGGITCQVSFLRGWCQMAMFRARPHTDTRGRPSRCQPPYCIHNCHCKQLTPTLQNYSMANKIPGRPPWHIPTENTAVRTAYLTFLCHHYITFVSTITLLYHGRGVEQVLCNSFEGYTWFITTKCTNLCPCHPQLQP